MILYRIKLILFCLDGRLSLWYTFSAKHQYAETEVKNVYFLLLLSIAAASLNSIVLRKAKASKPENVFFLNLIVSLMWCVILFIATGGHITVNTEVLFWGILYGITQTVFTLLKTAAMNTGSVTVTTLIGNSSLLITVAVSLVIWKETVTAFDIIGLALLLIAIFLCTYTKGAAKSGEYTPSWKYFALLFLLSAAAVGIVFKAFGKSGNLEHCGDMMFISSVVMIISNLAICLVAGGLKPTSIAAHGKSFIVFAVLSGILSCLYNRLNVFLTGNMDSLIFFPSFNGGVIFLSAVLSAILCGEKLGKAKLWGLAVGIFAICVIGIL